MLDNNVKKLNNSKITEEDRLKAKALFKDDDGYYNQELANEVLMLTVSEEELLTFLSEKNPEPDSQPLKKDTL